MHSAYVLEERNRDGRLRAVFHIERVNPAQMHEGCVRVGGHFERVDPAQVLEGRVRDGRLMLSS